MTFKKVLIGLAQLIPEDAVNTSLSAGLTTATQAADTSL
jgi:hypothetical protein